MIQVPYDTFAIAIHINISIYTGISNMYIYIYFYLQYIYISFIFTKVPHFSSIAKKILPTVAVPQWLSVACRWHQRPSRNRDARRTSKSSPVVPKCVFSPLFWGHRTHDFVFLMSEMMINPILGFAISILLHSSWEKGVEMSGLSSSSIVLPLVLLWPTKHPRNAKWSKDYVPLREF